MANPAFNDKVFQNEGSTTDAMTVQGSVNKTFVLLLLLLGTAALSWWVAATQGQGAAMVCLWGGMLGGLGVAIATIVKPQWSPVTAPIYSLLEGLVLGTISLLFAAKYQGIVMQAIIGTVAVFLVMLMIYRAGIIKVTQKFMIGVVSATGGLALFYLVTIGLNLFGVKTSFMTDSSPLGYGISAVAIILAALNLVLDFDFIQRGADQKAPKYLEWYAGFGLIVTLVWLYLEMLRLLARMRQ